MNRALDTTVIAPAWQQLGFEPGLMFRAFGMRRSGNHAILDWLLRNAPGEKSVFLNNCRPGKNPLTSFSAIEVNGETLPPRRAVSDLPQATATAGQGAMLLVSYEDTSPAEFTHATRPSGSFDEALINCDLIICRGFLNWSASLLRKLQRNPGYTAIQRTVVMLRAMAIYSRLLSLLDAAETERRVCIPYDTWRSSESFRGEVLRRLGLPERDNTLGKVQGYGGGSSFQADAEDPAKLSTDRRWQQQADDPEYQALLHLAARDTLLAERLKRHFPEDAMRLSRLLDHAPLPKEVLL
ncbi:hypothetical protein [Primorskyibacter sp. S87]|uniref:hypothetical protein n=1 Tax=Primorskyibacter sp. S87 TaxID=3415126 RepID=UPI003C7A7247